MFAAAVLVPSHSLLPARRLRARGRTATRPADVATLNQKASGRYLCLVICVFTVRMSFYH